MLLIVVAKINLAVRVYKHFTNKIANRQEKKRKIVKYFDSEHPLHKVPARRAVIPYYALVLQHPDLGWEPEWVSCHGDKDGEFQGEWQEWALFFVILRPLSLAECYDTS